MPSCRRRLVTRSIVRQTLSVLIKNPSISSSSCSAVASISTFPTRLSYAFINHLPAHHRVPHLRRDELLLRRRVKVAFDDRQIGELAGFDRAARGLFERGVRGI